MTARNHSRPSKRWSVRVLPDQFARDEAAPAGVAERLPRVDLSPAGTRHQVGSCPVGLDAVEEPVRAPLRTRQDPQLLSQPFGVLPLCVGANQVRSARSLVRYLVAYRMARSACSVPPSIPRTSTVPSVATYAGPSAYATCVIAWSQVLSGSPRPGVYKGLPGLVPDRRTVGLVHELVEPRPPHLVVGAGRYLLGERSWRGAPHGVAGVSGRPALHLDRAGVLDLPTHGPPVVLPEPVEYVREEDEPDGLVSVVVRVRVQRRAELAVLLAVEQPARARLELAPPHPPAGVDRPRRRGAWW